MDNILKETVRLIEKYHLRTKKKFGQNFLIDQNILDNIVSGSGITEDDYVVEVGPGLGNLTRAIAKHSKEVYCYEIDYDMVHILRKELTDFSNINILHQDVLSSDLSELEDKTISVVANLPYYITTAILFKFLESDIKVKSYTLMMQKEVANRLTGKVSTKDYNALSVIIQYKCKAELLFNVSKNVFIPKPNVDSAVVKLTVHDTPLSFKDEEHFIEVTKKGFTQRRKTLVNNLSFAYDYTKAELEEKLISLDINPKARAENLSVEDFINLSKLI